MDGKAHSEIFNTVITLKGLEFLKPDRTKTKANLAIIISAIAGAVSLGSLLVSVLANLDKIIRNLEILNDLLFNFYILSNVHFNPLAQKGNSLLWAIGPSIFDFT